jgi:hypothetical protein
MKVDCGFLKSKIADDCPKQSRRPQLFPTLCEKLCHIPVKILGELGINGVLLS